MAAPSGEGDGQEDRRPPDLVAGAGHRDGRQDRPGARNEQQAERQSDDEAPGRSVRLAAGGETGERSFEQ